MSRKAEAEGLAKPFIGITASGQVTPGLFTLKSTGVSTEPVQRAAEAFLGGLDEAQRAKTQFPVDDPEWRKWMNQHFYIRQGVSFLEMTPAQRDLAFGLLRASLSAKGLKLSRDIMKLNHTLGELNQDDFEQYGEWRYHITVMGKPSSTEPWGWQIDGHHLIVNYFVLGDQVVMSPVFVGSEPVVAYEGKYKGTAILQDEQNQGFAFFQSLSAEQRGKAVIDGSKTRNNNIGEAFRDNVVLDWAGVRANDLSAKQKADLEKLIAMYVSNMDDGHAKVKMAEVRKHLDETRFAWVGGADANGVYYYRIHSPVILIEFDHQVLVGIRHLSKTPQLPDRQHIHVVVRTPNGNDYGKDLLRQHYLKHPHGA
ncbi:MAG: DUF3500 domain-containing protein [Acidobacteria bacterium]|nr:DUF3500 domain-containing protein [Acidobacteriota bacterium]